MENQINNIIMKQGVIIAVDFDGTIVTHEYPRIGTLIPGAKETIQCLQENGYKEFLYTMRSHRLDHGQDHLDEAVRFLYENNIDLDGTNYSPEQFSDSPKQYAHVYIDDSALGCPLYRFKGSWAANWRIIANQLYNKHMLTDDQLTYIANHCSY